MAFVQQIDNDPGNVNSVARIFSMRRLLTCSITAALPLFSATPAVFAADKIDFALDVKPLLESTCLSCHGPEKPKGDLLLMSRTLAI